MTNAESVVDSVLKLADEVIKARQSALARADFRVAVDLNRWSVDDVEIQIEFSRCESLIDVVEDFVVKDGMPVTSTAELKQWLEKVVDRVLDEHRPAEGA